MVFRFVSGRQGTGYKTLTLFKTFLPNWVRRVTKFVAVDCYIIVYPDGSHIPPHTDSVGVGRHHRLNIILKRPLFGGEFICPKSFRLFNRIYYFRPDEMEHAVTPCIGKRVVFSLGFVRV